MRFGRQSICWATNRDGYSRPAAPDRHEVGRRQRAVTHQFTLTGRRLVKLRDLGFAQPLRRVTRASRLFGGSRPADLGQIVDQRAARDAKRPAPPP
jgi:hypothetical protein